jgi:hypothetical protein
LTRSGGEAEQRQETAAGEPDTDHDAKPRCGRPTENAAGGLWLRHVSLVSAPLLKAALSATLDA